MARLVGLTHEGFNVRTAWLSQRVINTLQNTRVSSIRSLYEKYVSGECMRNGLLRCRTGAFRKVTVGVKQEKVYLF